MNKKLASILTLLIIINLNSHVSGYDPQDLKKVMYNGYKTLYNVDLSLADLSWQNLNNASFGRGNLCSTNFNYAKLNNSNLKKAKLRNAKLIKTEIKNTNLQSTRFQAAILQKAIFNESNLRKAKLIEVKAQDASFKNCNLRWTNFDKANLTGANFSGAIFRETNLENTKVENANFKGALGLLNIQKKYLRENGAINIPKDSDPEELMKEDAEILGEQIATLIADGCILTAKGLRTIFYDLPKGTINYLKNHKSDIKRILCCYKRKTEHEQND